MEKDIRSYILNRVKAPLTTVEQFNWDNLKAPRISDLFSPYDLVELHNIATSIKLSSKTKEKIKRIDSIMYSRGFTRFISGTNRLTYRFIEDTSFIAKVAFNNIGTTDAPREYRNQMVLKPFVPKVFEYTPDGVLSIQERVEPITNREEFMAVSEDVYTLITEWLLGEYVFDDIGSEYFMNYGIRRGFGVVLLDFPYMFKVDYGKLICAAKDRTRTTLSGTCEGEIDYDDGFNELRCTKCGAVYTAKDLAKKVEEEKVLIKPTIGGLGKMFLNINISGGSKNVKSNEVVGNTFNSNIPNKPIVPAMANTQTNNIAYAVNGVVVEEKPEKTEPIIDQDIVEDVPDSSEEFLEETDLGAPDSTEDITFEDEETETPKENLDNPFIVHSEDDEEFMEKGKNIKELSDEDMNKLFGSSKITVDEIKDMLDKLSKEEFAEIAKYIFDKVSIETSNNVNVMVDNVEDSETENKALIIDIVPELQYDDQVIKLDNSSIISVALDISYVVGLINNADMLTDENDQYTGFVDYAASTINKKDIDQNTASENVFVLITDNGNYMTDPFGKIVCITKIDNKPVSNVSLISSNRLAVMNQQNKKEVKDLKPGATAQ